MKRAVDFADSLAACRLAAFSVFGRIRDYPRLVEINHGVDSY